MTTVVNEGFFADVVVVIEGPSDAAVLWKLQELLDKRWLELGVALVPANGKANIDRPVVIFRGLGIPTYFAFDGDVRATGTSRERAKEQNRRYLRMADVGEEDFPATRVEARFAVFEDELETEIKTALGAGAFESLRTAVAEELGYDQPSDALKNPDGAARFIGLVYDSDRRVPILERLVEHITRLASPQDIAAAR
jgi:hypothetical protein